MPSEYGVQWTGEAAAVFAIVSVVAAEFADRLADRTDKLAADPDLLDSVGDSSGGTVAVTSLTVGVIPKSWLTFIALATISSWTTLALTTKWVTEVVQRSNAVAVAGYQWSRLESINGIF